MLKKFGLLFTLFELLLEERELLLSVLLEVVLDLLFTQLSELVGKNVCSNEEVALDAVHQFLVLLVRRQPLDVTQGEHFGLHQWHYYLLTQQAWEDRQVLCKALQLLDEVADPVCPCLLDHCTRLDPVLDEQPQVLLQKIFLLVYDFGHKVQKDIFASDWILFAFVC